MNDWLEKELEDYIVANPYDIEELIFGKHFDISVLGRQVRCQYGIIDVLMWAHNENFSYVLVVECKAKHEKGLAVEQVSRYRAAIDDARTYDNLPDDAFPDWRTGYIGWMHHVSIETIPVLIAPSFSDQLTATYTGVLIAAQQTDSGFALTRKDHNVRPPTQEQLDTVLAPVIRRAHADAKARFISESFKHIQLGDMFRRN